MDISKVYQPSNRLNRLFYFACIITGILTFAFKRNVSDAVIYFGLALVFDPFDQEQKWADRNVYQKLLLSLHLTLVLALIVYLLF
jgi:hypothetical protein